jgi:UDP-N-acetylglucosamine diphosphorylase/glucosamine-1-phosphate N-acetyltransferase
MHERTSAMRICLFEDHGHAELEPLSLTRPVFDLLCGLDSLAAKQCRVFAPCAVGTLVRPHLADLCRLRDCRTPVNDVHWLRSSPTVLVNGRWLPPIGASPELSGPCVALVGDEVAYAVVGPDKLTYCSAHTLDDCLEIWKKTLPTRSAGGRMVRHLWDLVDANAEQLCEDFHARYGGQPLPLPAAPPALVGPSERLLIDPTARLDPLVVADTSGGPVVIDREAVIGAFSRLEGPCYIGPQTHVLGAKIRAGTTLGPQCRIGGEVEASIVHGHSNKYHDGFLGHSYLGEWINLGAGTSNSDLRNDYGPVTVVVDGRPVHTGQSKVGCFVGDHTKMGLSTLLNTGTSIGIFCNVLPAGTFAPKYVPSFCSWWNGSLTDRAELPQLFSTAATVMQRRGCAWTELHAKLIEQLFASGADERRRALRDREVRRLRRTA